MRYPTTRQIVGEILIAAVVSLLFLSVFTSGLRTEMIPANLVSTSVMQSTQDFTNPPEATDSPVRMLVVGDIMLDRHVRTLIQGSSTLYPLEKLSGFFTGYDLILGNLEGSVITGAKQAGTGVMRFAFLPEYLQVLKDAGFTVVSLANNHTFDSGDAGFEQTKEHVLSADVSYVGHPQMSEADYVYGETINGIQVIILAFNAVDHFDQEKTISLIKQYNSPDSFLVIMMHWGTEYQLHSSTSQQTLAHAMLDAGADVIIGAHPHVTQEIETYKGKLIFYSLGNFIFDQYFSEDTQEMYALQIELGDETVYTIVPLKSIRSQPMIMSEPSTWLEELAARSSPELREQIKAGRIVSP